MFEVLSVGQTSQSIQNRLGLISISFCDAVHPVVLFILDRVARRDTNIYFCTSGVDRYVAHRRDVSRH
jgi:hypothetical protein